MTEVVPIQGAIVEVNDQPYMAEMTQADGVVTVTLAVELFQPIRTIVARIPACLQHSPNRNIEACKKCNRAIIEVSV